MFGQNNRNMNGLLVNKLKQSKRKDKLRKLNNIESIIAQLKHAKQL